MAHTHVCPICDRTFSAHNIESHVDTCLTKSSSTAAKAVSKVPPVVFLSPPPSSSHTTKKRPRSLPAVTPHMDEEAPPEKKRQHERSYGTDKPMAERMRPSSLDDIVGQDELLGANKPLRRLLESGNIPNMILWGYVDTSYGHRHVDPSPPGCGKTTLASLISKQKKDTAKFVMLSATTAKLTHVREVFEKAVNEAQLLGRKTILFVDEIHRFTKLQQDTFLPYVENGTITLIGATTENPSFELNSALLSRCRVFLLHKIAADDVLRLLRRACDTEGRPVDPGALEFLAHQCNGDARVALNSLEMAALATTGAVTLDDVKAGFQRSHAIYDRAGDAHYDCISAMHKSIRGSDADAALYWLGRMMEGGENPLYVARRLIRVASEDVGLGDPSALPLAVSAFQACHAIGMPECDVILAHCVVHLARAPKSVEVYKAYKLVKQTLLDGGFMPDVPMHLRNAPTTLMKNLGYGKGTRRIASYRSLMRGCRYAQVEQARTTVFLTLEKCAHEESVSIALYLRFADLEIELRQFKQATKVFEQAVGAWPGSLLLWERYVSFCLDRQKYSNAKKLALRAIEILPVDANHASLWNLLEQNENTKADVAALQAQAVPGSAAVAPTVTTTTAAAPSSIPPAISIPPSIEPQQKTPPSPVIHFRKLPLTLPVIPGCPFLLFDPVDPATQVPSAVIYDLQAHARNDALFRDVLRLGETQRQKEVDTLYRWQDLIAMQMKEGAELCRRHHTPTTDDDASGETAQPPTEHSTQRQEFITRAAQSQAQFIEITAMDRQNQLASQQRSLQALGVPLMMVTTDAYVVAQQRKIVALVMEAEAAFRQSLQHQHHPRDMDHRRSPPRRDMYHPYQSRGPPPRRGGGGGPRRGGRR
ncbi:Aste57867_12430 [Aphanomyces stellatus]|uniref:Aste57867_12430 protein n=1 Tax=Aphanomyces stellatus TaxID=120398 RepID=A0A485KXI3_9STRA|nr:hypothetical protein As57867_012384 [Aphanomyces stellatus]VFT89281.1 Aste57867_12430 [Aphanomyces stellatus]